MDVPWVTRSHDAFIIGESQLEDLVHAVSVRTITGVREITTAVALGLAPVAGVVIARRRRAIKVLEKIHADALAHNTIAKLIDEFGIGPVELVLPRRKLVVVLDAADASSMLSATPAHFTAANREKRAPRRNIALFTASTALAQLVAGSSDYRLSSTPYLTASELLPATLDHFGLEFTP